MLIPIIGVLVFLAVASLILGLARRSPSLIEARMQDFRTRAVNTVEGEADLSVPFSERVLLPSVESLANAATSVLPARVLANIEKQLVMAGSPMSLNAYVVFWMVSVFLISGLMLAAVVVVMGAVGIQQALVVLGFAALGLVTTCVEAGLGLDAALARVAEKSSGPLADELTRMLREVAMGKLRREALTEMADRIGVDELTSFVNAIIQAEQLGVGIAQVLRVQSDQMRM